MAGLARFAGALTYDHHPAEDVLSDALVIASTRWGRIARMENRRDGRPEGVGPGGPAVGCGTCGTRHSLMDPTQLRDTLSQYDADPDIVLSKLHSKRSARRRRQQLISGLAAVVAVAVGIGSCQRLSRVEGVPVPDGVRPGVPDHRSGQADRAYRDRRLRPSGDGAHPRPHPGRPHGQRGRHRLGTDGEQAGHSQAGRQPYRGPLTEIPGSNVYDRLARRGFVAIPLKTIEGLIE